jgi:DNA-binding CsgD family transcriptional regulator
MVRKEFVMRPEPLKRRKDIITLLARGFSQTEIAEALNIPAETVYNDMREIRASTCAELLGHTKKEILQTVLLTRAARVKELWRTVAETDSGWVKVHALKDLRNEDALLMKLVPFLNVPRMTEEEAQQRFFDITDPIRGMMVL